MLHRTQERRVVLLKMIRTLAMCPLSADFVAPVAQLHPELAIVYASVVRRPMDLSTVARRLRQAVGYSGAGKVCDSYVL